MTCTRLFRLAILASALVIAAADQVLAGNYDVDSSSGTVTNAPPPPPPSPPEHRVGSVAAVRG